MKSKLHRFLSIALSMTIAMSLAACGGAQNQASSGNSAQSPAPSQVGSAAPAESKSEAAGESQADASTGDKFIDMKIGIAGDLNTLSPFAMKGSAHNMTKFSYTEHLCGVNAEGDLDPQVAKSWTTEDGKVYNVEIYDYVTDSAGNHITAADIEWSMLFHKAAGTNANLNKMESIKATGDYTLEIVLVDNIIGTFASVTRASPVMSRKAYEESPDEMANEIIATGHYVVEEFEPGSHMVLVKREDYWQTPDKTAYYSLANADRIEYKFIKEPSQMAIALETGDINVAQQMNHTIGEKFFDDPKYDAFISPSAVGTQLYFSGDTNRIVYGNPKLRQAVNVAIDIEGVIQAAYNGHGSPQYTVGPENSALYLEKWKEEPYFAYDPERAKQLLSEAGYAPGEVTLVLQCSNVDTQVKIAQVIQGYLLAVGINVEIANLDAALHVNAMKEATGYDMALDTVRGDYINGMWNTKFNMDFNKGKTFYGLVDEEQQKLLLNCVYEHNATPENIDAFHKFLYEKAYARGLCAPENFNFSRAELGVKELHYDPRSFIVAGATTFH
ncbi:ABC transporter substrate-binding protein [Ruminococcaceae bacterium OttesenSCG-928-L11]|nr:ABC transporter substrate-binding protein [Ruminococcaceae bacterium OttesenSCG-928-L11]